MRLLFLIFLLLLGGCAGKGVKREIKEGIKGRVEIWEGDFMPPSQGRIYYEPKTVLVFKKVNLLNCLKEEGKSTFYTKINSPLIDSVITDQNGYFFLALPPGEYSLFVRERGLFYANLFDGDGFIFPVRVEKGKVTEVNIKIDYKATY
ncbi:MAG: carboxypeptidase-like regulatory domain-containing protein [candidate division WOR-3 bacterium]